MIEKVKGILINGRCFAKETPLSFFPGENDRIAIVYGKNGSGKSTISDGFSQIASGVFSEELSASLIDRSDNAIALAAESKIFVFNEKYIDENVKIDADGLGTIILLGGQVDLQADIDHYAALLATAQREYDAAESALEAFGNKHNPLSPDYHLARIKKVLQGDWAAKDSAIKGNKANSKVTEEVIKEIGGMLVNETREQLQQKFDETKALLDKVADATTTYPIPVCEVTFPDGFEKALCSLLAKTVEKPVLTERESLILSMIQNGRQSIVEAAKRDFSDKATTVCPYCFREIDEEYRRGLIDSINKVLNKDVDAHKAELLAISFPQFSEDYSNFIDLDAELVKVIQQQIKACQELIAQYEDARQQKLSSVYNPLNIAPVGLESGIQRLNVFLSKLELKRQKFVDAIRQRKAILQELVLINKKIAHLQIEQAYRDYQKQQREMRAAEAKLQTMQKEVNENSEHLKALEQKKSNVGLAIENINNALDYVFFSHGRLSIELKNNKYYLKSNGKDVKPKNVSLGERNIIALCYFFTQILSNQDIGKLYQDEELVVIDDPISSFDFENKVGISSFLRYQTHKIIKGNAKSKILFLTHDLSTFSDLQKIADEMEKSFKKQKLGVSVKGKSFELQGRTLSDPIKSINEYLDLLHMIFNYAMGNTEGLDLAIGNSMRRALEAFSTFIYGTGIAEVSFDPKVIKSLGNHSRYFENLMYRLVLHGESHFETRVYAMQDDLSFYRFISEEEKQRTCKEVLCFMYCLSPDHIESHIPDAIHEIQKWMADIRTNEEFDIIANPKKRIIHLYDIPLSAGLGENILDSDIPFVEYETDVEDGDFALHVSGDSMEPDIPNGSTVFVKKQSEIADGISGAFFLNGEVYCKKLLHKDGKVFLCSDNAEYQPIEVHDGDTLIVYGKILPFRTYRGRQVSTGFAGSFGFSTKTASNFLSHRKQHARMLFAVGAVCCFVYKKEPGLPPSGGKSRLLHHCKIRYSITVHVRAFSLGGIQNLLADAQGLRRHLQQFICLDEIQRLLQA